MMTNWTTKHFAILAALLVAVGTQLGGLQHGWADAVTPGFVGGLILQIGTTLAALFTDAPRDPEAKSRASDKGVGV